MNDKELLELAARAAGIDLSQWNDVNGDRDFSYWNPLTDDGDALRLAVKLDLIPTYMRFSDMHIRAYSYEETLEVTRRAIVRAAAAIGKDMT